MTNLDQYRKNVAGIIFKDKKILLVHNKTHEPNFWKFPQGGIDGDETENESLLRELSEELGTGKFKVIEKSLITHQYDWPPEVQLKKGFLGQLQTFWYVEFLGEDNDFDLSHDQLDFFKWVTIQDLPSCFQFEDMKELISKIVQELLHKNFIYNQNE